MAENRPPLQEQIKHWGLASSYRLAKTRFGGRLLNLVLSRASSLLPFSILVETESLLAFHHPRPGYPVHVLILPKRAYQDLLSVPSQDAVLFTDLLEIVQQLVLDLGLEQSSYRLILNGGQAQDVKHLHFHLVGENHE